MKTKLNIAIQLVKLDNAFLKEFVVIQKVCRKLLSNSSLRWTKNWNFIFLGQCTRDETCNESTHGQLERLLQDLELTLEEMIDREDMDNEYWTSKIIEKTL